MYIISSKLHIMTALFSGEKPTLSPKDFVVYSSLMISLYVSTFAFLALIFEYISFLFPDQLSYVDPYSTAMRTSIATLFVVFPLFIALTRYTNNDIRAHKEKAELGYRKWLIYITLLIAGATMIIDLIVLVNSFLAGDITVAFISKVLAVLVVVGSVFTYFVLALKGYWEERKTASVLYGSVAGAVVVLSVVLGFFIMGSPSEQRLYRFDEQKVIDLQNIQWQVLNYWQTTETLPASLDVLSDPMTGFITPIDPETGEVYEYIVTTPLTFSLCATFNKPDRSSQMDARLYETSPFANETWTHKEGRTCFDRVIDPKRYDVKM